MTRRVGAVCSWTLGLGFGLPCVYGTWHFARRGEVATVMGYPTYGDGPFERVGMQTSLPLLTAFLAVCAGETATGWLLWRGRPSGPVMALALLPFEMAFWVGFALPYAPPLGLVRTAAVLAGWRRAAVTAADDVRVCAAAGSS